MFKLSINLQPLVIFSFFIASLCLFKATLLCTNTDTVLQIILTLWCLSTSSVQLHESYRLQGPLNRDRKGLSLDGARLLCVGAFRAQEQYGNPQRSGQGHKGQSEWRKRKKGVWGSTYQKHGQPTASTTAFFWSWLSFAVLLKFHKYSNATFHKKINSSANFKAYFYSMKLLFYLDQILIKMHHYTTYVNELG